MEIRGRGPALVLTLALGLAAATLAACTSDGSSDPDAAPDPEPGPLREFLGLEAPRNQARLPQLTEQERQRQFAMEQLIAQCMAQRGYEYRPVPPEQRLAGTFAEAYALPPEEFARQYGYGVTTLSEATGGEQPADPNQQIRDALPAKQRAGYDQALWGAGSGGGSDAEGCQPRASAEVYGDPSGLDEGYAQFQDLLDQIGELYRQIEADPRLREGGDRWAECLADAGFGGFAGPNDARQSVFDRLREVQGAGRASPDPAELAAIRDYELALAPVDLACRREHLDRVRQTVTAEREQAFLDAHRAELERYRDWLAETRSGG